MSMSARLAAAVRHSRGFCAWMGQHQQVAQRSTSWRPWCQHPVATVHTQGSVLAAARKNKRRPPPPIIGARAKRRNTLSWRFEERALRRVKRRRDHRAERATAGGAADGQSSDEEGYYNDHDGDDSDDGDNMEDAYVVGMAIAGESSMAGPLIAAAVRLPIGLHIVGLAAPDALSVPQLKAVYAQIVKHPDVAVQTAQVSAKEIDVLALGPAMLECYNRAVDAFMDDAKEGGDGIDFVLAEGSTVPPRARGRCVAVSRGREKCASIAAAAVVAHVQHLRLMLVYHSRWPAYGFAKHHGRPTGQHREAIRKHGATSAHRLRAGIGSYAVME